MRVGGEIVCVGLIQTWISGIALLFGADVRAVPVSDVRVRFASKYDEKQATTTLSLLTVCHSSPFFVLFIFLGARLWFRARR